MLTKTLMLVLASGSLERSGLSLDPESQEDQALASLLLHVSKFLLGPQVQALEEQTLGAGQRAQQIKAPASRCTSVAIETRCGGARL